MPGTAAPALLQRIACVRDFSLFTHTVVYVSTAVITFEVGRGVECMMQRRLAQPCLLSLYYLPAHAVVYGLGPLLIKFEVGRGVLQV